MDAQLARPDRSFLQESKESSPEGACDSQPLARESMDQAVYITRHVRIYSVTSPIQGRPVNILRARHPTWRLPVEPSPQ